MESKTSDEREKRRSRGNKGNQHTDRQRSARTPKFSGLNKDELEGIVICENVPTPTAQQYDNLYDALIVYGGSRNPMVRKSLRSMKYIKKHETEPDRPTKESYTDTDGAIDKALQTARMNVWEKECEAAYKRHSKYAEAMESLFGTIMGQLSLEIRNNLKGSENWDTIDDDNDTLGLLKNLRELCYRDNNNRVHEGIDLIAKLLKFLQSRQNDKSASTFVEETTNRWEVFKSTGGTISSPPLIKYVLRNNTFAGKSYSYTDYVALSASTDKSDSDIVKKIHSSLNQTVLALVIVNGSNDKMHQGLRLDLLKDFAKGHDNYPRTANAALDLLNQFKSKTQTRPNPKPNNPSRGADKKEDKNHFVKEEPKEKTEKNFTTIGKDEKSKSQVEKAHQLLLKGVEQDDDSYDDFIFLQYSPDPQLPNEATTSFEGCPVPVFEGVSAIPDDYYDDDYGLDEGHTGDVCSINNESNHSANTCYPENASPINEAALDEWAQAYLDDMDDWSHQEVTTSNSRSAERKPGSGNNTQNTVLHKDSEQLYKNTITQLRESEHIRQQSSRRSYMNLDRAYIFAQQHGGTLNPWWLLLDSQATCNIICNPRIVENIRKHPEGNEVTLYCNAGSLVVDTIANLKGFGTVWFHKDCIANCLSLALVSDRYRVTLDTTMEQGFFVHRDDGSTRRFDRDACNLYVCDLRQKQERLLITTVRGQKEYYSDLDFRRAKAARKLQETIGFPSLKEYLRMIDNNLIKNCAVTRRDILMAEDIYGVNANIVKGKTVRRQPGHVREDITPVPPEILKRYRNVTLGIDIYHINGIRFFRSISRHLMFRMTQPIADAKAGTLFEQVKKTAARYATRGFKVTQIYGDNEFNCIHDRLEAELKITFSPVARGAHEPFVERDNRVSKERCRCIFSGLPFKRMPPRMTMEMPIAVDYWLNYWCSSGGVSKHIPPRQIMTGIQLDANKHCKFQYGDYVLAHNDTDNTMKPRASDAIYLRPTGTPDGSFFVFDLKTGQRVRRRTATLAHMTDGVIERVNAIAKEQKAPIGIVFGDYDNNVTILDLDTESIATEDDDNNASDSSYQDEEDSIDSRLTNVESESEHGSVASQSGYAQDGENDSQTTRSTVDSDNVGNNTENNVQSNTDTTVDIANNEVTDNNDEPGPYNGDNNDEEANDDNVGNQHNNATGGTAPGEEQNGELGEEVTIVFEESNDDFVDTGQDGSIDIVHPSIYDEQEAQLENARAVNSGSGRNLRPSVTRTHPKYGVKEGFSDTTRHRNLFCHGYSRAAQKLVDDHVRIILVAQAVEQYANMNASLVTPQYTVNKGLQIFGEDGTKAVLKELQQLHDLNVISPIDPRTLTKEEIKRALPYLMFLKRKRCGKIKGRGCADGRSQREFISKDDASSPTASLYAIILTCLIDAIEDRCVATTDIPGAFLQTQMPEDEIVHIRITGAMAELLGEIDNNVYGSFIKTTRKGNKVLYARANKAIYGTLRAALLFWKKLKDQLSKWGFESNPYDACTMNKIINNKQATIVWHVDDLKISHKDQSVVEDIINDLDHKFGSVAPLSTVYGKVHDYLGMTIDFSTQGQVKFSMYDYLQDIIDNLPEDLKTNRNTTTPAADHLFDVNESAERLDKDKADEFHHYTAKLLFAAKRARPDIQTAIAFLCTRVKGPDIDDRKKLIRVLGYIKDTIFLPLTIGWDGSGNIYWYVDASFAVHNNMRSHTGSMITFGVGAALSMSTKQKINTKSSTEAELVGVDDALPFNIWCMYFLREQGYHAHQSSEEAGSKALKYIGHRNILYQDNTSSIKLETNGKASSTKRTRHIHIRYFLITDKIKKGDISTVEYCPTEEMIADYFTKPLQGSLFRRFRNAIMGVTDAEYLSYKLAYEKAKEEATSPPDT